MGLVALFDLSFPVHQESSECIDPSFIIHPSVQGLQQESATTSAEMVHDTTIPATLISVSDHDIILLCVMKYFFDFFFFFLYCVCVNIYWISHDVAY